jgi:hypothetical protein
MSQTFNLLEDVTTAVVGEGNKINVNPRTIQATVEGTGALTADIEIHVSNDHDNWILLATINLAGVTAATDGFVTDAPWSFTRARLVAVTGTDAVVNVNVGV